MDVGSLLPIIQSVMGIGGTASGLFNSYKNAQYQDKLRGIAENPQKFQKYRSGFVQPLTAGLEKGVGNSAQAYAAERGLATSPSAEQSIYDQAIAPYIQQQQNQATQDAFQTLGVGGGANPGDPSKSLASSLEILQKLPWLNRGGNQAAPDWATGFTPDAMGPQYSVGSDTDWSSVFAPSGNSGGYDPFSGSFGG